jgi:hypothetical protein
MVVPNICDILKLHHQLVSMVTAAARLLQGLHVVIRNESEMGCKLLLKKRRRDASDEGA